VETFRNIDQYIDPTQSLGKALIKKDLLTKEDLNDGLMFQMREVTLNIFPLFEGSYEFQARSDLSRKRFEYKMNVPDLIEEGIRRMDYNPELEKSMKTQIPVYKNKDCLDRLTTEEIQLLKSIDGKSSAKRLFKDSGLAVEFFWKSLYLFYCLNLIDIQEAGEEEVPAKKKKPKKKVPLVRKKGKKAEVPEKEKVDEEKIQEEMMPEEVVEEEKEKLPEPVDDKTQRMIDELEALSKEIESMNYYQILNLPREATQKEIKKSYFEMARQYHPDRFSRNLPGDTRDMVEEVFGHITRAFQTLNNEKEKKDYDENLDSPAEVDRKELDKQADAKFRQGKGLYNRGKYEDALVYFEEAIRLKSSKADYFMYLAMAESKVPSFHEKAEEDFHKALELEPWNAQIFAALGDFYEQEGLSVKAKRQFKKALEIDPEHERALEALGMTEKPEKKGLKGIISLGKKKKKKS
jgi:curved DNA-binding protein CbpA